MGISNFTDDILVRRFLSEVRIVSFDLRHWIKCDGGWKPVAQSPNPKLPLLEPIREFCRRVQEDVWDDASLTEAQIEQQCYRLGKLSTFRTLHNLLPRMSGPNGAEFANVSHTCMQLDALRWFDLPATKEDFTLVDAQNFFQLRSFVVAFKGRHTEFYIKPTPSQVFGTPSGPPYKREYKDTLHWPQDYPNKEEALKDTAEYILNLMGTEPPPLSLRVIDGGKRA
jgi:hypothetical protein